MSLRRDKKETAKAPQSQNSRQGSTAFNVPAGKQENLEGMTVLPHNRDVDRDVDR